MGGIIEVLLYIKLTHCQSVQRVHTQVHSQQKRITHTDVMFILRGFCIASYTGHSQFFNGAR